MKCFDIRHDGGDSPAYFITNKGDSRRPVEAHLRPYYWTYWGARLGLWLMVRRLRRGSTGPRAISTHCFKVSTDE